MTTTAASPAPAPLAANDRVALLGQRLIAVTFWFVVPLFCLFVLGAGVDKLVRHLNNVPAGITGTYTVLAHNCSEQLCVTRGTFVSDNHFIVATDQLGPYGWNDAETHRVVYDPSSANVIPLPAQWDPTAAASGMAGAVVALCLWSWCLFHSIRRRVPA
ncbi:MAG: hypothetical protein JO147_15375 [Actinobacteria bacterium]|nr:hypothetical protein [Actinomycetota bacterium]